MADSESRRPGIRDEIVSILVHDLGWSGDTSDLHDDTDLLETRILDSLALLDFVNLLEARLAINIRDDELVPDNFRTLRAAVAFVSRKTE